MVSWPMVSFSAPSVNCLQGTLLCCFATHVWALVGLEGVLLVHILNSLTSEDPNIMHLLRSLLKVAAFLSFTFAAVHVPGKTNGHS